MDKTGQLIKLAMGTRSINTFAAQCGISKSYLSRAIRGQVKPSPEVLKKIAAHSETVAYDQLMHSMNYITDGAGIPIYGTISAGRPIEAIEDVTGYIRLDYCYAGQEEKFLALRVSGDSMDKANIPDGSIAIIRKSETLRNGEIGAVMIDGDATIKEFFSDKSGVSLIPHSFSSRHPVQKYSNLNDVRVIGKVVKAIVNI